MLPIHFTNYITCASLFNSMNCMNSMLYLNLEVYSLVYVEGEDGGTETSLCRSIDLPPIFPFLCKLNIFLILSYEFEGKTMIPQRVEKYIPLDIRQTIEEKLYSIFACIRFVQQK